MIPLQEGKALRLTAMRETGLVPPFTVLDAQCFDDFLAARGLAKDYVTIWSPQVSHPELRGIAGELCATIARAVLDVSLPEAVRAELTSTFEAAKSFTPPHTTFIARSSASNEDVAGRSRAGSFLSVHGITNPAEWERAVRRIWASAVLAAGRAWPGAESEPVKMAVILQQEVEARASGVVHLSRGSTPDNDESVVEAVLGLGKSLNSADSATSPERWRVIGGDDCHAERVAALRAEIVWLSGQPGGDRPSHSRHVAAANGEIVELRGIPSSRDAWCGIPVSRTARMPEVLAAEQVQQLHRVARSVALSTSDELDVEWAIDGTAERIWIVQVRSGTPLPDVRRLATPDSHPDEDWLFLGRPASPGTVSGELVDLRTVDLGTLMK